MRTAICAVCLLTALCTSAISEPREAPVVPVGTVVAERRPITANRDFVGRVEAINRVDVRARVKGYLEQVLFKEGDLIKEGADLYQIEKGLFEADVKQAEGALERSKAALTLAKLTLDRAQELLDRNTGTVVARDQARAQVQTATGAMMSDEANLQTAKINLGYTDIAAAIAGKISRTNVTKGNVVGPDSGVLTTIVSQDPMYVTFPVSQREFLRLQQHGRELGISQIKIRLRYSDGVLYDQVGSVNFVDVMVDRGTDTVLARATMPNPNSGLMDNQLMRVDVEVGAPVEKVVVPQAALISDQQGVYVFVVEDGKAVVKRLKLSGEIGADVVVEEGLSGGELVIVQGLQGVRPGAPVRATPLPKTLSRN
jgi:membrane fusion protein (multidrug efflux system)